MLDPQDFRDVLVISRERSLKAAAQVLKIDPSTMGRRLEGIESRFGAPLFLRTAQGFELTPEGTTVAAAAEKMEAVQLAFQRELLAHEQQKANALVVTVAEWGVPLLTPVLVELAESHPEMQLRLRIENRALDLTRREADLALRVGRPSEKSLMGRRAGVVVYGLYAATSYLDEHPAPRSLAGLSRHTFCSFDQSFARTPHVRWQADLARDARVVLQTNSMLALIEAIEAGAGLSTLPCALAETRPKLRRVLPDLASVERELWLVFHRDLRKSRGIRLVVDTLLSRIKPMFAPPPRARRT
ncbi:MAG: Transcriptional regulator, LysR family [Labilithrix sp.]|nr:Transcriptional regulator, LysR family [Labilithrix sp.]